MAFRGTHLAISRPVAISFLIASVIHIPLPQPDFHNIRHHDGPGEVCGYHDHLLRWHPSASEAVDVSVLHWHWVLPLLEGADPNGGTTDDPQHHRNGTGPALHANVGDGLEPDWSTVRWLAPEAASISLVKQVSPPTLAIADVTAFFPHFARLLASHPFRTPAPPCAHSPRLQALQRWNC